MTRCKHTSSSLRPAILSAFLTDMAPHMSPSELDFIQTKFPAGKTPAQVHKLLETRRGRKGMAAPDLTNIRKALKGLTYKRGLKETRGRKPLYSRKMVRKMNMKRRLRWIR